MRASLLATLFLVACLDPEAPPAEVGTTAPGGGAPSAPPPQGTEGGGNTPPPAFELPTIAPGTGVKLSGTTTYAGTKTGKVRIDVLSMQAGATMPGLVATKTVDAVGAWEIEIPKNAGDVHVVAFLDLGDNGPDATDPAGRTKDPVKMAEAALGGVSVEILDSADLGDLTPGNAPRGDSAPKTGEPAKPADGAAATTAPPADGKAVDPKAATAPDGKAVDPKAPTADGKAADAKVAPTSDAKASAVPASKPVDAKSATAPATKAADTKPAATEGRTKPAEKKASSTGTKATGGAKPAPAK